MSKSKTRSSRYAVALLVIGLGALTQAQAGPGHFNRDPLLILAHDVEGSAYHLHDRALRTGFCGPRLSRPALRQLARLEERARRFHRELRRHGPYAARVHRDFDALDRAYRKTGVFRGIRLHRATRDELRRLDHLMSGLRSRYAARLAYRGPGRHRGARGFHGSVYVEKRGGRGYGSIGLVWDDEDEDDD